MKKKLVALTFAFSLMAMTVSNFMTASAASPIVAFPGAEGAGKYATGGRGGSVYHVTNLDDSGPGSFRDAVSRSGRIIVFDVGGTINLKSDVVVKGDNTIAGQTAPGGGGITLKGGKIGMGGNNIIIRFVSSRPGENGSSECDAWGGNKGSNSMIDHCSIGWANDEQYGLYSSTQQTVQYSIIGPSNCISYHSKGAHGFGIMMGAGHNTWHHNMIAHNISRNFRGKIGGTNTLDYVNNVIYNWGYQTAYGTFGQVNYVGNYFKRGLSTAGGNRFISISSGTAPENYRFYLTGNKMVNPNGTDYNSSMNSNNWIGVDYGSSGLTQSHYQVNSPLRVNDVYGNDASVVRNAQSADAAFQTVLSYAGAGISAKQRPKIDQQVMEEARTGTGYLTGGRDFSTISSSDTALNDAISKYNIKQVNYDSYYPAAITKKTIVDTDNDGMPDDWEAERGLNPYADDAMGDYLGQGYNNIEYYINDLTVNAFPAGVVKVSPKDTGSKIAYNFDFGNGAVQSGYKAVTSSTSYTSVLGYGFVGSQGAMTRAPGNIPSGYDNLHADQIEGTTTFKANIPNGTYYVRAYYGSWNEGFGTRFNIEGVDSGALASTTAAEYVTKVTVKDGVLDVGISIGDKKYGGYINGLDIIPTAEPKYKFDFGDGAVQSGFTGVTAATTYTYSNGYGFEGTQSAMTRAPGNIPSGYDNLHADQINGTTMFKADMPNGKYNITIHYGSWNTSFGTSYVVEGVESGPLSATDAATYTVQVEILDGMLDVAINRGEQAYGGYINGLEISPVTYVSVEEGVYYLKNVNSGLYLDVANGSNTNGANVQQYAYNGSTAQQFKIVSAGNGYYKLLTGCSDYTQAVDVSEASAENSANILTWASGSGANQQFKFKPAKDGSYAIMTRSSNLASALDVAGMSKENGANVCQYEYWGGTGQMWYLEPVQETEVSLYAVIKEGVYCLKNVNSGLYLDVADGSSTNGANIQQHSYNGSTAQQFKIVATGDGCYQLLTGCSNYAQAVDVSGASAENNANILAWSKSSQNNQKFVFVQESDGSYGILTKASDMVAALDVYNMSKDSGANVCQWEYWGGAGQRWFLEAVN